MSKPDMGSIFHIKNQLNILVIGNYYVNYQNYPNVMLSTSSDTKRTLMHLFFFTNSAQRELVSICTQSEYMQMQLSYLALYPCIYLSIYLYIYLSFYLSIYLSIYLSRTHYYLVWDVKSPTPILEYRLLYRKIIKVTFE